MFKFTNTAKRIGMILIFMAAVGIASEVKATHFRYGKMEATPILNNGVPTGQMTFRLEIGLRRGYIVTNVNANPFVGMTFTAAQVSANPISFGDGLTFTPTFTITSIDVGNDTVIATTNVLHTYTNIANNISYLAFWTGTNRLSQPPLLNGWDQPWRIEALVRPGSTNRAPSTALPAVITVQRGNNITFTVPGSDQDITDQLRFRLATVAESGFGVAGSPNPQLQNVPPGLTIGRDTGVVTWNNSTLAFGMYTAQFVIEDIPAGSDPATATAKSKTVVDVLLNIVNVTGTAPTALIDGLATPKTFNVEEGQTVTFSVGGTDPDLDPGTGTPTTLLTLTGSGVPVGATNVPSLPFTGKSPVNSNFTWVANALQGTSRVIAFTVTDPTGLQKSNSVTIFIETNKPPTVSCPAPISQGASSASGATVSIPLTVTDPNNDQLTVAWKIDGLSQPNVNVTGTFPSAAVNLSGLFSIGSHTVSVTVTDPKNASATCSASVTVTVSGTTTTLLSNTPTVFGQTALITATVSSPNGTPTGTVTFSNGGTDLGTLALVAGKATLSTAALPTGTATITAQYNADAAFTTSTSAPFSHVVNKANTTTTITSDHLGLGMSSSAWSQIFPAGGFGPNLSTCGQSSMSDGAGRMIVYARTVCGGGSGEVWVLNNANGIGSPNWTLVAAGGPSRHAQTTVYDKATNRMILFGGCSGGCFPTNNDVYILSNANGQGGAAVWTLLSTTGGPPVQRNHAAGAYDPISNRLIIYGGQDGGGAVVGETFSDVWVLSNANIPSGSHTWTQLSTSGAFPTGVYQARAFYDSVNNRLTVAGGARSDTGTASSAVNVLTNANGLGGTPVWTNLIPEGAPGAPAFAGWNVDYDAASNRGILAQQSTSNLYYLNHANGLGGPTTYSQVTPTGGSGANPGYGLVLDVPTNRVLSWSQFGGGNRSFVLNPASTSTFGETVTFTATVAPVAPGAGAPAGTVQFFDGVTPIGGPQPVGGGGTAALSIASLTVGSHNITAAYGGDTNFNTSASGLLNHSVTQSPTTTTVSTSGSPSVYGGPVTFTSTTLSGGSPVTLGTVTFIEGGTCASPGLILQTANAININGNAAFTTSSLTVPSHTITACYDGTAFAPSSGSVSQTVNKATLTVTADNKSITFGDADPGFTFQYGSFVLGEGSLAVGTAPTCTVPGPHSNAGSYPIVCSGGSAANYNFNFVNGTLTIAKATPTVSVTGGTFTYDGASHPATGSVTGVGGANLGSPTFTYTPGGAAAPLNAGSYSVLGAFAGNGNYEAVSNTGSIIINKADAAFNITPYTGVYDAAPHNITGTASGAGGVDLTSGLTFGASFTDVPGGTGTWNFAGGTNYNDSSGTAPITITKATATFNIAPYSGVYDAQPHNISGTASGVGSVDLTSGLTFGTSFTDVPGGTGTWSFVGGNNYNDASGNADVTITKATASFSITPYSGVYDAAAHNLTGTASGVAGANLTSGLTFGTSFTDVPGGTGTWSFAGGTNYNDSSGTAPVEITKATATFSITPYSGTYDGAAHNITGTASGVGGVDLTSGLNFGSPFTDVPGGTGTWTFNGGTNYNNDSGSAPVSITKASATINITPYTGVYDGAAHNITGTASGVAGADLTSGLSFGSPFTDVPGGTGTWTFAGGTNYNDDSGTGAVTITPAGSSVTVTCPTTPQVYTGAAQTPCTAAFTTTDGLSGTLPVTHSANVNVGTAGASASYAGDGNHQSSSGSGSFTISKAASTTAVTCPASVTFNNAAQTPCTVLVSGAGGLNLTPNAVYANNTNAGTASASYSFTGDANHLTSSDSKNFTINKAATTTLVTFEAGPYVFRGSAFAATAAVTGPGLNQTLPVAYSGDCTFVTVPNGCTGTATYTESANYLGSTDTKRITIISGCSFFDGFKPPIGGVVEKGTGGSQMSPLGTYRLGSTIPVKFSATCYGAPLTTGVHILQAQKWNGTTSILGEPIDATPTDAATTGGQFRLTGTEWHYNLDTKNTPGFSEGTWLFKATLFDGSTYTVWVALRR
jgi:hypothetical protein